MIKEIFTWSLALNVVQMCVTVVIGVIYVVCGCSEILSPRLRSLEVLRPVLRNLYVWLL